MRVKRLPLKWSNLMSIFRPLNPACPLCRKRKAPAAEVDGACCEICYSKINLIHKMDCMHCGRPVDCPDCRRLRGFGMPEPALTVHRSAAIYDQWLKYLIAQYKYRGNERLQEVLGHVLMHGYAKISSMYPIDVISFVPISGPRAQERGFNQAQQIAEQLSKLTGLPLVELLKRDRHMPKQSQQSRAGRLQALHNVYTLHEEGYQQAIASGSLVPNKPLRILVVDDVYTTGTTLEACAQTLQKQLGADVCALTLGRS